MDSNASLTSEIVSEVEFLRQNYKPEELAVMLQGEANRITSSRGLALSSQEQRSLVQQIINNLGDEIVKNRVFTSAVIGQVIVAVVNELANNQIIPADSLNQYRFLVAVTTAIVLNSLYKTWEDRRDSNKNTGSHPA